MREDIDAFIEPIVDAAHIASRRRRDELRRELRSHFEESGLVLWASTITIGAFSDRALVSAFRTS